MKGQLQNQPPLVVAVIGTDTSAGRAELRGVSDAARRLGWALETIDTAQVGIDLATFRPLLERASGVIVRLNDPLRDGTFDSLDVPLAGIDVKLIGKDWPDPRDQERAKALWVATRCDHRKVAEAAADELLATGRRCFAFVPMLLRYGWTEKRGKAFLARIRDAGADARLYQPHTKWDWGEERIFLAHWLTTLPRPFGLFAGNDLLAKFALDACHSAELDVPGDAAIIGADDDETLCLTTTPTLSSVRLDFEGAGRRTAEALDALIGKPRPLRTKLMHFGVLGVARRGSTRQNVPGEDPRIAAGLDFISLHYADPFIGVRDVAVAMGTGRRQADRIFVTTGKTIRQHIEEARLTKARAMLKSSSAPIGEVARLCGFSSNAYFSQLVRKRFGVSPSQWNG